MLRPTKKVLAIALTLLIVSAAAIAGIHSVRDGGLALKTYQVENGWGYSIALKGKVIINQPFIPAVEGRKPFESKSDAAKTGRMVMKKIRKGEMPTITIEELKKAGIIT